METEELEEFGSFLNDLDNKLGAPPPPPAAAAAAAANDKELKQSSPRRTSQFGGNLFDSSDTGDQSTNLTGQSPDDIINRLMSELTARDARLQALATENEELRQELNVRKSLDTPSSRERESLASIKMGFSSSKSKVTDALLSFGESASRLFSDTDEDCVSDGITAVDPLVMLGVRGGRKQRNPQSMSEMLGNANLLLSEHQREDAEARRDRDWQESRAIKARQMALTSDFNDDEDDGGGNFHSRNSSRNSEEEQLFRDSDSPEKTDSKTKEKKPSNAEMEYQEFVHRLMKPECEVLVGVIRRFLSSILGPNGDGTFPSPTWKGDYLFYGTENLPKRCQDFFEAMREHFLAHPSWRNESEDRINSALDCLEKYVMTRIAELAFRHTSESKQDENLSRRMQLLSFLQPVNLEIRDDMQNELIWALAVDELRKINSYKTPGEKIECVVKCASVIFRALTLASLKAEKESGPCGADDFFPAFLWTVLRSHVPKLYSNCCYIHSFHSPRRLLGKGGYVFVALRSAIEFVLTCDADQISGLGPGEYDQQMLEKEKWLNGGM